MGVKGLSESGITTIPRIFVHSEESLSDIKTKSSDLSEPAISIPIIDLAGENIADQVKEAAKTWGFFQIVNHKIQTSIMDKVISSISAFHDMSFEDKSEYQSSKEGPSFGRGVSYSSNMDLVQSGAAIWCDTLRIFSGFDDPPAEIEIPEICRREASEWLSLSAGVAEKLLEILAEGLGLEPQKFRELDFLGTKLFAGHCYPPCPEPDKTLGVVPHTDKVVLTVLMQNHVSGLQVKHGGSWVDVKPIRGSLIVNVGDLLEIASNGEYTSVQHRVLANSYKETRISIAMFFGVGKWKEGNCYGPLPELLSPENPAKYRYFSKEEFYNTDSTKSRLGVKSVTESFKI